MKLETRKVVFSILATLLLIMPGFSQITLPEDYLGFKPGADFHLANYEQAIGYFEQIASQTDRMQVHDMGPTSYGKRMKYAIISSEANMARLNEYKEINAKLSLVRGVTKDQAEQLAEEGKVVVWIDCGLHASESSPAQHAIQLAYDIVTGDDRRTRLIRDNVIFLLVFANPDGLTMIADWYMKNVGTKYETTRPPTLYQKYAGHDNNRDSFIANLQEIQNMNKMTCQEWFPEVLYNLHETAPFPARIWIPPESEPTNPNYHPMVIRWKNLIGSAMGKAFDEEDKSGVISRIHFDSWYPGYATQFVDGHNIPSILTETANAGFGTPKYYTINDFPPNHRDLVKGVFYPNPWEGGWWRLGDAVAYNLTASKAVLEIAAKFRYEFLYNKWKMGSDNIERFQNEPPYGWIISADQKDQHTTALFLNRCILNGVEIYNSNEAFEHNGIKYPKGSYIIPTSQPFGLFAKLIMEIQEYPDLRKYPHLWQSIVGTAKLAKDPLRAYDGVGWTLPVQMGLDYHEMSKSFNVPKTLVIEVKAPEASISGGGSHYAFSSADNGSYIAVNRIQKQGGNVSYSLAGFTLNGKIFPKGSFVLEAGSIKKNTLRNITNELKIDLQGGKLQIKTKPLSTARVALFKSLTPNMDAGWLSLVLERYEFNYHELTTAEIKAGHLKDRFDAIIFADQRASSIINGARKGTMHPDYIGGITMNGVDNLKEFVQQGGTLICNKSSSELPITHFKFPIKNILKDVKPDSFSCPGALLKLSHDNNHPLTFGLNKKGYALFSRGWAYEVIKDTAKVDEKKKQTKDAKGQLPKTKKQPIKEKINYAKVKPEVVASFPDEGLLISGWMLGDKILRQKAAIMNVPFEKGNVVLFGFNVHNRAQSYANFKLLFNAIYY